MKKILKGELTNNASLTAAPLTKDFFEQPTLSLAKSLLGCLLVKETEEGITSGFIVETEAYSGPEDQAAHSYNNRRTARTEIMYGEPGHIYTYVMHTHCLVNIVSGPKDKPEAVLIRAIEPFSGIELMKNRRGITDLKNLTNGPGKLTKAMGISMEDYGRSICEPPLYICSGFKPSGISQGKRIGIDNAGEAREYPWRFWETDNPFVSRHRKQI
ncbi:3-methyladenine DNA glycosylase [Bacillus sp. V3-13]|uniref:DNA-3-methyladenine glycosylase n=1 Tax=Bacillus sp. V3-13 TaxID=2053728 RepID=UPI000C76873B|nr:DNA-3-methyladenine glycosylase [Bacillus sp. V3-13]PLR75718.1 3-methyladenine DNA glycosylase [Bacillus sp. V3-13]